MTKEASDIDLTDRASFSVWTPVSIRFSDQDPLGHVNNVAMAAYVEAGRTMLIQPLLNQKNYPDLNYALVRLVIDYRAEFHYPGIVDVGGRIIRVGTKSFSSGFGLFIGDLCVATSQSVNVFFDTALRASVEPPEEIRSMFMAALEGQLP